MLTWKASATPVLITSDTQIDRLEKKGVLSERATSIRAQLSDRQGQQGRLMN
jgi:hypothetical protein